MYFISHFWGLIWLSPKKNQTHLHLLMLTVIILQRLKKFGIAKCTMRSSYIMSNGLVIRWLIMSGTHLQIWQKQMGTLHKSIWCTYVNHYLKISIKKNGVNVPRSIIDLSLYYQPVRLFTTPEMVARERRGTVRVSYSPSFKHTTWLCLLLCFSFD